MCKQYSSRFQPGEGQCRVRLLRLVSSSNKGCKIPWPGERWAGASSSWAWPRVGVAAPGRGTVGRSVRRTLAAAAPRSGRSECSTPGGILPANRCGGFIKHHLGKGGKKRGNFHTVEDGNQSTLSLSLVSKGLFKMHFKAVVSASFLFHTLGGGGQQKCGNFQLFEKI